MVREAGSNLNRTIEIDWGKYREQLMGIQHMVSRHATSAKIDGDRDVITINEPDDVLIEELESRGIEYEEV